MTTLEIIIDVTMADPGIAPQARFWVDLEPDGDLGSEMELSLEIERPWRWHGSLLVPRTSSFFYRMGIRAAGGMAWSLCIRDRLQRRDLLVDSDAIASSKLWSLGSCHLQAARAAGPATARSLRPCRR